MERLTDRWRNADTGDFLAYHLKQNTGFEWNRAVKKLGQYEDAEEDGRIIALQCKPKDEVYCFFLFADCEIQKANVVSIELKKNQFGDKCYFVEPVGRRGCLFKYYDSDFGKTIFLTRGAAGSLRTSSICGKYGRR